MYIMNTDKTCWGCKSFKFTTNIPPTMSCANDKWGEAVGVRYEDKLCHAKVCTSFEAKGPEDIKEATPSKYAIRIMELEAEVERLRNSK